MLPSRVCKHPSPLAIGQQWLMSSLETGASPLDQCGKAQPPLCLLCPLPGLGFSPHRHQLSVPLLGCSPGVSAGSLPLFGVWAWPAPTTFPFLRLEASPCPPTFSCPNPHLGPSLHLGLRLLASCVSPCVELTGHLLQNMWLGRGKRGFALRRGRCLQVMCSRSPRRLPATCDLRNRPSHLASLL